MSPRAHPTRRRWPGQTIAVGVFTLCVALAIGSIRDPGFWRRADRRGDALLRAGQFQAAATVYTDPERMGVALYRAADFEAAAKAFARVPGAIGAFNAGNAWLMHGKYDQAVAAYERALSVRSGWTEAKENRALAVARRERMTAAGDEGNEGEPNEAPDEIVFDDKARNAKSQPQEIAGGAILSDVELQATWLRRVQTTPSAFLRAKFASQVQHSQQSVAPDTAESIR